MLPTFAPEVGAATVVAPRKAASLPPLASDATAKPQGDIPTGDFSHAPHPDGSIDAPQDSAGAPENFAVANRTVVGRDARSTTYDNHDGTSTVVLHNSPVNWRDQFGAWRPIDGTLAPAANGRVENVSGPVRASFSGATDTGDVAHLSADGWSLGFRLAGQRAGKVGARAGSSVRYSDVVPGIDLVEQVGTHGMKEFVVLNRPLPAGTPTSWRFPLSLTGLTPRTTADGSIAFADASGNDVLTMPQGYAEDSAGDPTQAPRPRTTVKVTLVHPTASTSAVDVSIDGTWLNDPARVYPVSIDPSVVFYGGLQSGHWDSFVSQSQPTTNFNSYVDSNAYTDLIGIPAAGQQYYTYMKYDLSAIHGHTVTNAMWNGFFYSTNTYSGNSFAIYQAAGAWTDSAITWNSQPGHTGATPALGNTTAPNQWLARDITGWVQPWVDNGNVNYGVSIDTRGLGYYFKLASDEQAFAGQDSYLAVTFNNTPAPWPSQASQSPPNGSTMMSSTPTLSVPAQVDAEGDTVRYWFRMATGTDAETGQVVNSGWLTTPSWAVPAGSLQDGVTYSWKVFTWDGWGSATPTNSSWPPSTLKINLRLGDQSVSPTDSQGPVSVNLANGNAVVHAASPTFNTVGGAVGVSYTYNSGAPSPFGLTGAYYNNCVGPSPAFPAEPTLVRRDANIQFNWGLGSPAPGIIDVDNFCVRWTGFITTPRANRYCFQGARDDGMRVWINNTLVVDSWADQATTTPPFGSTTMECTDLLADHTYTVQVDYYEHSAFAQSELWIAGPNVGPMPVPSSWLTPTPESMPAGWTLSAGGTTLRYAEAKVSSSSITLVETSGATHEYRRADTRGLGWVPEPGEDAVVTTSPDGWLPPTTVTVADPDGLTYTFNNKGKLTQAVSANDDTHPAAPIYVYSGDTGRLAAIQDPVSGRQITLTYSSPNGTNVCPAPASGFSEAPTGLLCLVSYWDGTATNLYYNGNGQLARLLEPGGAVTDFAYDGAGRMRALRDPLQADVVAGLTRPDDDTTRTVVAYDGSGRAQAVTLALPTTGVGVTQPQHSYRYVSGSETQVDVAGLAQPNGYARRATFDTTGRAVTVYDTAGLATTTQWDSADRPITSVDAANRKSTTIYDAAGRATDAYGPAPATCFTGQVPNGTCTGTAAPPHTATGYDEGINGLAAAYWNNQTFAGAATSHATGVGDPTGALTHTWGTSPPTGLSSASNWSARYTGDITFPSTGTYTLKVGAGDDQGTRVLVDDKPVIDAWAGKGDPALASWGTNRLDLFVRGTSNNILHKFWNGTSWSTSWEDLGGPFASDPAVVSWGPNRLDVFVRGMDNALWHRYFDGGWGPWESLAGILTSAPAVASWGVNHLDIFSRGTDNGLYQVSWTGSGWSGWTALGGNLTSGPAAVSWGPNRIDVFSRGVDNALWHRWYGGTWGAWESLGGTLTSAPDAASWGANRLDVFSRSTTNTLDHRWWDGSWHSGDDLGGVLSSGPGAVAMPGTNRLDIIVQGSDTSLHQKTFSAGWSAFTPVTDGFRVGTLSATAGQKARIRVDTFEGTAPSRIDLRWLPPGGTEASVPGTNLSPRYGLATSTLDPDQRKTTTQYANPENSLATSSVVDPLGLALTTQTGYEAPGSAYLRRVSKTMPSGATSTYAYYGASEAAPANTCGATDVQAGLLHTATSPDPDGAGSQTARVEESVYDLAGRVRASRVNGGGWACVSYDARGRLTSKTTPAFGAEAARTVTYTYAVGGNPLVTSVADAAGTITTTVDLLGRVVSYTDVWGNTTTTSYDQTGRATDTSGPAGSQHFDFDANGRLSAQKLDNVTVAVPTYNLSTGELSSVSYPTGAGNGGNGTSLSSITRDSFGRTTGLSWLAAGGGSLTTDAVTRSFGGRVLDESVDGTDAHAGADNFTYDGAGRLTDAWVTAHHYAYGFAASPSCALAPNAGRNTNRSSVIDNGGTATTYCYDAADKLVGTTDSRFTNPVYDARGNTIAVGTQTMVYDGADRHVQTALGASTLRYIRDATDRVVARLVNGSTVARYGSSGGGDSSSFTTDASNVVLDRTIGLPGGVLLTKRASGDVWSYPNIHGDVVATANAAGTKQGVTLSYDPYG
ncbi:MAG TPA: PA14 domain-containing protein, partial [Acidimicrobiales bacterium]|nr:PA14 domain-containing protein [Acidimicrobiales bacterium]